MEKLIGLTLFVLLLTSCKNKDVIIENKSITLQNTNEKQNTSFNSISPGNKLPESPGEKELNTINKAYPETSIETLNIGFQLYYFGACIDCHKPKEISKFELTEWKTIIDKMAIKAKISDEEKDAVYKYVLSVRASK